MGNENKWEKGTFEKIDECIYKINGNYVTISREVESDLIPIIRDIVDKKEKIIIEKYNLSRSTYFINEKVIPVADLISEINIFLDSLLIQRKNLENGICYYKTKNRELSVEEEIVPFVEDIINRTNKPVEEYELQKETYLINNKLIPVNDIITKIHKLLFRDLLGICQVNDCHYNINGEEFFLQDDNVQILYELSNDEDELNKSKYERRKCIYDDKGNKCLITRLCSYIVYLWDTGIGIDNEGRIEMKEILLNNKMNHNLIFAEKVFCFITHIPPMIVKLIIGGEKEYYQYNKCYIEKIIEDSHNAQPWTIKEFVTLLKNSPFEIGTDLLGIYFEGSNEEMELLRKKIESEKDDVFIAYLIEKLDELKIKRRKDFDLEKIDNTLEMVADNIENIPFQALSELCLCELQAFVNVYCEEYERWKDKVKVDGVLDQNVFEEVYRKNTGNEIDFLSYYLYFEGHIFDRLFHAMNRSFIRPEVMKSIISKLQELGLSKYVQERYDKYRRLTGGGKDFCFCKLDVKEVAKELSRYYANLPSGRKNYSFTDYYLYDVVNDIIPNLKSGLDVAAFALLLWKSKLFVSSTNDANFTSFRDDIARIFQLDTIPNISNYTAGKPKVKEKANDLKKQFKCLDELVEQTLT